MTGSWRFNDVTAAADFWPITDTINVSNSQPCQLATFTGQISGDDVLDDEHEVIVYYTPSGGSEGKVFAGDVSVYTRSQFDIAANDNYSFSARDYTARLDDTILTDAKRDAETVDDAIAWIMGVAPTFDLTNGAAESISTMLPAYDYTGNSKREALQHIAGIVGAVFYIDFDKALQFYLADTTFASDFDLSTSPDLSTTFPYANFRLDSDTTERADDVWAQGDGVAAWRPTSTPSGGRQRSVNASGVKDLDTIQAIADAELERIGTAQVSGTLTTWTAGLISGQTVHIVNSTHSIDDDFVISQISIRYMQPNDLGGTAEFTVQFADRLTCRPQIDLSNTGGSDGNGDGGGCGRAVVLTDLDSELSLESGPDDAIYLHDGSTLAKFRVDLQTKVWEVSASGGVPYVTHQPGTYVPLCLGDKAYRRDTGVQRWDITSGITALAAQTQDARRFWVTGGVSVEYVGINESTGGNCTLPAGWAVGDVALGIARDATFGGITAAPSGWTLVRHDEPAGLGMALVTRVLQMGDTVLPFSGWTGSISTLCVVVYRNVDTSSIIAGTTFHSATTQPVTIGAESSGDSVVGVLSTAAGNVDTFTPSGMTNRSTGVTDGSGHKYFGVADLTGDYGGGSYTGGGVHLRCYTIGLNASFGGGGGSADTIQVRETLDGSLVTETSLTDPGDSMRRSASGEFAMVQQSTDTILRFDRDANLDDTVTITDFFPTDDWAVDDAYNLYQLLDNVLTKYDRGGTVLWTVDLNARHSYLFPSLITTGNGNQVIADDFVRVCGYIGGADWSTDPSEACLITMSKVDGSTKIIQRFGGDSDDNAQAQALHHHADGCIFLAGAAAGTEFEGLTLSGTQGWLMRVGQDDITDPGSEVVPASATDLTDHLTDPTDAHDASAVSIVDSGSYFTGTDVEAALQELGAAGGGGGSVATDAIWDAKGDLAGGTGANTAAKLTVGANKSVLTADSAQTTGLKWLAETAATPAAVGTSGATGTSGHPLALDDHAHAHEAAHIQHDTTWAAKGDLIAGTANDTAAILGAGSNNQVLVADSSQTTGLKWATAGGGGAVSDWTTVTKSSDETVTNSGSQQADDELFFTMSANSLYIVELFLLYNVGTTPDFKFSVGGAAGGGAPVAAGSGWAIAPNTSGTSVLTVTGGGTVTAGGTGAKQPAYAKFLMWSDGSGGTCGLYWSENTATIGTSAIVYAGSVLRYQKII